MQDKYISGRLLKTQFKGIQGKPLAVESEFLVTPKNKLQVETFGKRFDAVKATTQRGNTQFKLKYIFPDQQPVVGIDTFAGALAQRCSPTATQGRVIRRQPCQHAPRALPALVCEYDCTDRVLVRMATLCKRTLLAQASPPLHCPHRKCTAGSQKWDLEYNVKTSRLAAKVKVWPMSLAVTTTVGPKGVAPASYKVTLERQWIF